VRGGNRGGVTSHAGGDVARGGVTSHVGGSDVTRGEGGESAALTMDEGVRAGRGDPRRE